MNDDRLDALLGSFYRDTALAPRDRDQGVGEVMDRVRRTRQRGRWLPFPLFRRRAPTPTATDTADYRLRTIPATNGHAPIVIGRTQTMFSPVKAIVAGALVFALGGMLFIAQPFDQQGNIPGAEQAAEPPPPVFGVRTTASDSTRFGPPEVCTTHTGDGTGDGYETCTFATSWPMSATDPRLSGTATAWIVEHDGPGTGKLGLSAIEIVNDEGSWVGTGWDVESEQANVNVATLTGEEAYEGLTAFLVSIWDEDDDSWVSMDRAIIVEGELPPFPELPE